MAKKFVFEQFTGAPMQNVSEMPRIPAEKFGEYAGAAQYVGAGLEKASDALFKITHHFFELEDTKSLLAHQKNLTEKTISFLDDLHKTDDPARQFLLYQKILNNEASKSPKLRLRDSQARLESINNSVISSFLASGQNIVRNRQEELLLAELDGSIQSILENYQNGFLDAQKAREQINGLIDSMGYPTEAGLPLLSEEQRVKLKNSAMNALSRASVKNTADILNKALFQYAAQNGVQSLFDLMQDWDKFLGFASNFTDDIETVQKAYSHVYSMMSNNIMAVEKMADANKNKVLKSALELVNSDNYTAAYNLVSENASLFGSDLDNTLSLIQKFAESKNKSAAHQYYVDFFNKLNQARTEGGVNPDELYQTLSVLNSFGVLTADNYYNYIGEISKSFTDYEGRLRDLIYQRTASVFGSVQNMLLAGGVDLSNTHLVGMYYKWFGQNIATSVNGWVENYKQTYKKAPSLAEVDEYLLSEIAKNIGNSLDYIKTQAGKTVMERELKGVKSKFDDIVKNLPSKSFPKDFTSSYVIAMENAERVRGKIQTKLFNPRDNEEDKNYTKEVLSALGGIQTMYPFTETNTAADSISNFVYNSILFLNKKLSKNEKWSGDDIYSLNNILVFLEEHYMNKIAPNSAYDYLTVARQLSEVDEKYWRAYVDENRK